MGKKQGAVSLMAPCGKNGAAPHYVRHHFHNKDERIATMRCSHKKVEALPLCACCVCSSLCLITSSCVCSCPQRPAFSCATRNICLEGSAAERLAKVWKRSSVCSQRRRRRGLSRRSVGTQGSRISCAYCQRGGSKHRVTSRRSARFCFRGSGSDLKLHLR